MGGGIRRRLLWDVDAMIKINWAEVSNLKSLLKRQGQDDAYELVVMILYHNNQDSDRIQVALDQLEQLLFTLESDRRVRSLFLYDLDLQRPFLKIQEAEQVNALETVPNSGHPSVVRDFNEMPPEAKQVWVEITYSKLLQHLNTTGVS